MKNKKIILAISINHEISRLIERNLKFYNFEVLCVNDHEEAKFRYPSIWSKLIVNFKREIIKDREAKRTLESKILLKKLRSNKFNQKFDYGLFILAQNYSLELIKFIKENVTRGNLINYQWDGMGRYPHIYKRLPLFDRIYAFNPSDFISPKFPILFSTNFYFDFDLTPLKNSYQFYFLGSHNSGRFNIINQFARFSKEMNWNINFNIYINNDIDFYRKEYEENITLFGDNEIRSYDDNLLIARQSEVLVDFIIDEHTGLSFRVFEALGYDKKLITTNVEVKKYDFYHPNNIFVLNDNFEDIPLFLTKPYHMIDPRIKKKYSFGNWINYILDIEPYIPIELPRE